MLKRDLVALKSRFALHFIGSRFHDDRSCVQILSSAFWCFMCGLYISNVDCRTIKPLYKADLLTVIKKMPSSIILSVALSTEGVDLPT